ncbi:COMM domain-containing protein 8 isoform X2 [Alligator mississippiensis]|uniref:COMM domain-containing protein 8 isoform X2 n=1 Tax=Alligator mississippiensis TaxID=8496 RepID=UPI00090736EC|nr:COMM domain-containing protein 8 isoform X2 [Alligator mississippiensis]
MRRGALLPLPSSLLAPPGGRRAWPVGGSRGADMRLLEKLPAERAAKFLHKVVDGICGRAYPRYPDYSSVWNLTGWMEIVEETATYFKTTVGKNLSDEEAAQQLNELNSSYQEAIIKCLKARKEEIRPALVEKINAISSAQLQDFDWQLKLALSSDKISMLQIPLLNLDLDVRENGEIKPVSIEMNKEELQNLINALEAANKLK